MNGVVLGIEIFLGFATGALVLLLILAVIKFLAVLAWMRDHVGALVLSAIYCGIALGPIFQWRPAVGLWMLIALFLAWVIYYAVSEVKGETGFAGSENAMGEGIIAGHKSLSRTAFVNLEIDYSEERAFIKC